MHKQPKRKPIRRRARAWDSERKIRNRKLNLYQEFLDKTAEMLKFQSEMDMRQLLNAVDKIEISLNKNPKLKCFLEKRGVTGKWIRDTANHAWRLTIEDIVERTGSQKTTAISRKDEVEILKKMGLFLAAIEEAKRAGIT